MGPAVRRTRGHGKLIPRPGHFRGLRAHSRRAVAEHSCGYSFSPGPSCPRLEGTRRPAPGQPREQMGRAGQHPIAAQHLCGWSRLPGGGRGRCPAPADPGGRPVPAVSCHSSLGAAPASLRGRPAVLWPLSSRPTWLGLRRTDAVRGPEQHGRCRGTLVGPQALPFLACHLAPTTLTRRCGGLGSVGQLCGSVAPRVLQPPLGSNASRQLSPALGWGPRTPSRTGSELCLA